MNKNLNKFLYIICTIFAIYGLIILIRKIVLPSNSIRKSKKDLGYSFYIEPYIFYEVGEQEESIETKNRKKNICISDCKSKYGKYSASCEADC